MGFWSTLGMILSLRPPPVPAPLPPAPPVFKTLPPPPEPPPSSSEELEEWRRYMDRYAALRRRESQLDMDAWEARLDAAEAAKRKGGSQ